MNELQGGYLIAVVDHDNKASIRSVKMGQKVGGWCIVDEGLKAGERVVAEGTQQVKEGAQVNPKPYQENSSVAEKLNQGSGS